LCACFTATVMLGFGAAAASADSARPNAAGRPPVPFASPHGDPETDPGMHRDALSVLYDRLGTADSEAKAAPVMEAIEKLWLKSGSPTVDLLMERALISTRSEKYDLAIALLTRIVEFAPAYAEGWNQLAVAYFRKEDYRSAVAPLQRALMLEPRHYKAVEGMGVLMRELGDKAAALAAFRHALQLNPASKAAQDATEQLAREVEGQRI
jgi:Flp pilus assembly protein TadD